MANEQTTKQETKVAKPKVYSCTPRVACEKPLHYGKPVLPKTIFYIEDGIKKAKPGDPIDLKTYLNASLASTDIANIVARLKQGDQTVINVNPNGITGDVSKLPHSINDINDLQKKFEDSYEKLPEQVKNLFKTPADFMQAALDNTLKDIIKKSKQAEPAPKKEPVPEPVPEKKEGAE